MAFDESGKGNSLTTWRNISFMRVTDSDILPFGGGARHL